MTKTILILAIILTGFGTQSAYAAGCTEENIQHWNKIIFVSQKDTTWTQENEPDLVVGPRYEVIVQVSSASVSEVDKLVSDKLNEIGYTDATNGDTPEPEDFLALDFTYSSFCDNFGFGQVVGGMLLQPDTATLLIAYGIANSIWIVPSVAGIGIAVYLTRNRLLKH